MTTFDKKFYFLNVLTTPTTNPLISNNSGLGTPSERTISNVNDRSELPDFSQFINKKTPELDQNFWKNYDLNYKKKPASQITDAAFLLTDLKLSYSTESFFFARSATYNFSKNNFNFLFDFELQYSNKFYNQLTNFSSNSALWPLLDYSQFPFEPLKERPWDDALDFPSFLSFDDYLDFNDFLHLKKNSFIHFFVDNLIDVPICFKKSHSLKRKNLELPLIKFINFLTKKGKKEFANRALFKAFGSFYTILLNGRDRSTFVSLDDNYSWLNFFRIFYSCYYFSLSKVTNTDVEERVRENARTLEDMDLLDPFSQQKLIYFLSNKVDKFSNAESLQLGEKNDILPESIADGDNNAEFTTEARKLLFSNSQFFFTFTNDFTWANFSSLIFSSQTQVRINPDFFNKNFFLFIIGKILPVFTFYIYNVDKNVRKFSRGKSGKYVFVWKYIPLYKRFKTSLKLIAKQVKFYNYKTFEKRILNLLLDLHFNSKTNFLIKRKNFTYNYVFKNFKKSLMSNLKTLVS